MQGWRYLADLRIGRSSLREEDYALAFVARTVPVARMGESAIGRSGAVPHPRRSEDGAPAPAPAEAPQSVPRCYGERQER